MPSEETIILYSIIGGVVLLILLTLILRRIPAVRRWQGYKVDEKDENNYEICIENSVSSDIIESDKKVSTENTFESSDETEIEPAAEPGNEPENEPEIGPQPAEEPENEIQAKPAKIIIPKASLKKNAENAKIKVTVRKRKQ